MVADNLLKYIKDNLNRVVNWRRTQKSAITVTDNPEHESLKCIKNNMNLLEQALAVLQSGTLISSYDSEFWRTCFWKMAFIWGLCGSPLKIQCCRLNRCSSITSQFQPKNDGAKVAVYPPGCVSVFANLNICLQFRTKCRRARLVSIADNRQHCRWGHSNLYLWLPWTPPRKYTTVCTPCHVFPNNVQLLFTATLSDHCWWWPCRIRNCSGFSSLERWSSWILPITR